MNLLWSVLRSWTSYQTLSQNQLKFHLLTMMMNSELSLHNRGATTIQTDSKPIQNLARDSQPHDICRSLTYIYQPTLRSSKTRTAPRHPRAQYSTIQPITTWVHATLAISPLQCASSHSHNRLAELRLTGLCGQYYKVSSHAIQQQMVLNRHRRKEPAHKTSMSGGSLTESARSRFITPHSHITR